MKDIELNGTYIFLVFTRSTYIYSIFYKKQVTTYYLKFQVSTGARLAQLVERKALNLVVVGSSPTVGVYFLLFCFFLS